MAYCPLALHAVLPPHNKTLIPSRAPSHGNGSGNGAVVSKSKSVSLYTALLQGGILPNAFTFPSLLKSLATSAALAEGTAVHAHVVKFGLERDAYVRNGLMWLYASCGDAARARALFDDFPGRDVVSWTTMVSGYAKMGLLNEAVDLFFQMAEEDAVMDAVAAGSVFAACSELGDLELSKKVHRCVMARKVCLDGIAWNALIHMYAKCGDTAAAYRYFKKMPVKSVVTWNTMISGLARAGELRRALALFRQMRGDGMQPDDATFVSVLGACAQLGALDSGRWIHAYMGRSGCKADGVVGNALLDMYAKCGAIDQAMEVFDAMACRDVYTYTSMILGLAMHGRGEKGLDLFAEMLRVGVKPNEVTFIGVLSACCHAGLVGEGLRHFESMSGLYGVTPKIEHYGCVVDMLGRAGMLDKAEELIGAMPVTPDALIWGSLLAACKMHGDVERGERVMQRVSEELEDEEDEEAGDYVLMSNIYASEGRHGGSAQVRKQMRRNKIKKVPGCSLIEIDGVVHEFQAMSNKSNQ